MSPAPLEPASDAKPKPEPPPTSPSPSFTPAPSPSPSPTPTAPAKLVSAKNAASEPRPSPIPPHGSTTPRARTPLRRPYPDPPAPNPKLRLKVQDLTHAGAAIFFKSTDPSTVLPLAITAVISILYTSSPLSSMHIPPTRSVTLVLRDMDGVAYTTCSPLDDDHKQIHLSLTYVAGIACARQRDEICGVMVHEMVHCWQWNADGTAPGGLIEGIADFVRLKAGLAPPHWTRGEGGGDWDAGYQHTAYFLDWLEGRYGEGTVQRVNERLRRGKYVEREFWKGLFHRGVKELWREYKKSLRCDENKAAAENVEEFDHPEAEKAEKTEKIEKEEEKLAEADAGAGAGAGVLEEESTETASSEAESQESIADDEDSELILLRSDGEEHQHDEKDQEKKI